MLAKILSAGALTLLLSGGALAYALANANPAPYGYNDAQGSHALGGGPGST